MRNSFNPYLLGIAGPSCSGKTELAKRLVEELRKIEPVVISLDSYYRDLSHMDIHDRSNRNFDHPDAIDLVLLCEHLLNLKAGKTIHKPVYDFILHTRKKETEIVLPHKLVIVEGLFTLYRDSIRNLFNKRVYVEIDKKNALMRRLKRDIDQRGRSNESVQKQFYDQVIPMAEMYVRPTQKYADVTVNGANSIGISIKAILDIVLKDLSTL